MSNLAQQSIGQLCPDVCYQDILEIGGGEFGQAHLGCICKEVRGRGEGFERKTLVAFAFRYSQSVSWTLN